VTAIYRSREAPIPGVSGEDVVEAARRSGHRRVEYLSDWRRVPDRLVERVEAGDLILTLGAGDIYRLARQLGEAGGEEVEG
ncbi:MAG: UDP-N-acetylmuramate--L-alanine ligase, partial [bacterium]|nr:UDP-N-acetylmuramate--L-alanine ligase [bacterium]